MNRYKPIFKMIGEAWKIEKRYFLIVFCSIIIQTGLTIISMYIPAAIVDRLSNNYSFVDIFKMILVFMAVSYLLKQGLEFVNLHFQKMSIYQSKRLEARISEKAMSITYKELENPGSLDLIQRAELPIAWGLVSHTLTTVKNISIAVFTILGLGAILLSHSLIYTAAVFSILIMSVILRLKLQNKYDALVQQNVSINRKYGYFFNTSLAPENQKEFRLYNLSDIMTNKLNRYNEQIADWIVSLKKAASNLEILDSVFSALITFTAFSYNAVRLFSRSFGALISIGRFTLIYNSTNTIMLNMQIIAKEISQINHAAVHLTPWNDFIELKDEDFSGSEKTAEFESLEFKNVSFTYPGSDRLILDNISFKINKGEKISIAGLNNAGKSTIVKLICKFFKPDGGEILWNGKNIYEYENGSYIDQISAVFQDFKLFPYTIFENIMPDESDRKKAEKSLKEVNMYTAVSELEKGMDTYLSKDLEEEAVKFSGGQSQKLAIARAINKGGSLMIMDEPTAALDPIAESEIFENFAELTRGKTAIFISHRMSSSTFSDKVLLLDDGKIAGFESHKNLMKEHNLYRDLFETQAKNYA